MKNIKSKFSVVAILVALGLQVFSSNYELLAKTLMTKSTNKDLIIEINLTDEIKVIDKNVNGKNYKKIDIIDDDSNIKTQGVFPEIEYIKKTIIFAAPKNSKPKVDILYKQSKFSKIGKKNLIPAQKEIEDNNNGMSNYFGYVRANNTKISSETNKDIVQIKSLGYENGLNLFKIEIYPLRFSGVNASILTNIGFKISYNNEAFNKDSKFLNNYSKSKYVSKKRSIKANKPKNFFESNIINFDIAATNRYSVKSRNIKPTFLDLQTQWIKLEIVESGIYKVTGSELSQLNGSINLSSINLDFISVFSSAGQDLNPDINDLDEIFHGAEQISRRVIDINNNDIFEEEDYILFYATGISGWKRDKQIIHYYNRFNSKVFYWIELGIDSSTNGKEMEHLFEENLDGDIEITDFDRFQFFDDRVNHIYSHEIAYWYTSEIVANQSISYNFKIDEISSEKVIIDIVHDPIIRNGDNYNAEKIEYIVNSDNSTLEETTSEDVLYEVPADKFTEYSTNNFSMKNTDSGGKGYSKYLWSYEIKYKGKLNPHMMSDNNFAINIEDLGNYKLNIIDGNDYDIYEISDLKNVKYSRYNDISSNCFSINDSLALDEKFKYFYIANSNGEDYLTVPQIDIYDNSNKESLHSLTENVDMVIITPSIFMDYMESEDGGRRLINAHLSVNDTSTFKYNNIKIVNLEEINFEFGRGYQEPTATRNFIKYANSNWDVRYVLLIGDGTYDYRNINNYADRNLIFPSDFTDPHFIGSDQFYAQLGSTNQKQVAIGRFPIDNQSELINMIDKTVDFIKEPIHSNSRSSVLLVADDERNPDNGSDGWNESWHIDNTEKKIVPSFPDNYIVDKVYLTEYPFEFDAATGRQIKPKAAEAIVRKLNQGTSVFLYVGHGAPAQISHEVVFNSAYFQKVNNIKQYFLQMGAACSTGLFDNPLSTGFTEEMVKAKNRGSVAGINNTRSCYSYSNENFFKSIFNNMFYEKNNKLSVGESMRLAHNDEGPDNKIIGFMLIGDPAVRIFRDYEELYSSDIGNIELTTLRLDTLNVTIIDNDSLNLGNIDAVLDMVISDSERRVAYFNDEHWSKGNNKTDTLRYNLPGNQIISTKSSILNSNGFTRFVLPKDLSYGEDKGKINFYAYSQDKNIELTGAVSNISIVADTSGLSDNTPPNISILFNDFNYKKGDPIPQDAVIIIDIFDENGINSSGGIGHKLMMEIDGKETILNNFFSYYLDNYQAGYCSYQVFGLSAGTHTIKASAWDTFNNYNEKILTFTVSSIDDDSNCSVGNILNYPNPITDSGTNFTFTTVNPALVENIKISVFTINGRKVNVIDDEIVVNTGSNFQSVYWNGKDFDGDELGNGVYFYKVEVKYNNGKNISGIGKLFFAR